MSNFKQSVMQFAESVTGNSKLYGRSQNAKKKAREQRRRKAARMGLESPIDANTTAAARRNRLMASSGRAATLLSDDDRLGG